MSELEAFTDINVFQNSRNHFGLRTKSKRFISKCKFTMPHSFNCLFICYLQSSCQLAAFSAYTMCEGKVLYLGWKMNSFKKNTFFVQINAFWSIFLWIHDTNIRRYVHWKNVFSWNNEKNLVKIIENF